MRMVDRVFGYLLALGGILHGVGSWAAYHAQPVTLLWALATSYAVLLLAALNLLRAGRPKDHSLAWVCFGGCLVWIGFVLWFGLLIGNLLEFRPLIHLVLTAVLAAYSLRGALQPAP